MSETKFRGAQFRALRQSGGIRMVDVARAAGCHYRHLAQWEKGTRHISTELAYRLARALTELTGATVTINDFTETTQVAA